MTNTTSYGLELVGRSSESWKSVFSSLQLFLEYSNYCFNIEISSENSKKVKVQYFDPFEASQLFKENSKKPKHYPMKGNIPP